MGIKVSIDNFDLGQFDDLVMLFSSQSEEALSTMEGKQMLKEAALNELINALQEEGEAADVQDVLFTSFIVD